MRQLEMLYAPERPDLCKDCPPIVTLISKLTFSGVFSVLNPQPLSGLIVSWTYGFQPEQALALNESPIVLQKFASTEVNQSISVDQQEFA